MQTLTDIRLEVEPGAIFGYLGMDDPRERIRNAVEELSEIAMDVVAPRASYRALPLQSVRGGTLSCRLPEGAGTLALELGKISVAFQRAQHVVFFLVTIGKDVDEITRRMQHNGRVFESSLFDSVCSYLADDLAARLQSVVAEKYDGLHPTHRFSPGYCDWALGEQSKIFSVFPDDGVGVSLNGSCAMSPRKSVSGIFGLVPDRIEEIVPCQVCRDHDCSYRRDPADEEGCPAA